MGQRVAVLKPTCKLHHSQSKTQHTVITLESRFTTSFLVNAVAFCPPRHVMLQSCECCIREEGAALWKRTGFHFDKLKNVWLSAPSFLCEGWGVAAQFNDVSLSWLGHVNKCCPKLTLTLRTEEIWICGLSWHLLHLLELVYSYFRHIVWSIPFLCLLPVPPASQRAHNMSCYSSAHFLCRCLSALAKT